MDASYVTLIVSVLTLISNVCIHLKLRHLDFLFCSSDCLPSQPNLPFVRNNTRRNPPVIEHNTNDFIIVQPETS